MLSGPGGRSAPKTFVLWGLTSVAVFGVLTARGELGEWHGIALTVPYMLATAWFGWRASLLLGPVVVLLLWAASAAGFAPPLSTEGYASLFGVLLLATLVGAHMHRVWRTSEERALDNERRARLLQQAAMELNQADDHDALFATAPRILSEILAFSHAELFVPRADGLVLAKAWRWDVDPGFRVPHRSVMGRALRTGEEQYVPDTTIDPDFVVAPGAAPTKSELALPVTVGGEVRAVLNLEHDARGAFGKEDRETLTAFARIVAEVMERLDVKEALSNERAEQEFLARLSAELLRADDPRKAAGSVVNALVRFLGLDIGGVLELKSARLHTLYRTAGLPPDLAERADHGLGFSGLLREAWETGRTLYAEDVTTLEVREGWSHPTESAAEAGAADPAGTGWSAAGDAAGPDAGATDAAPRTVMIVPLSDGQGEVRYLLAVLSLGEPRALSAGLRSVAQTAGEALGAALTRIMLTRRLFSTLEVLRQLARTSDPQKLYRGAAEAAIDLIPGAEAASVMVRDGDLFRFEAAQGYDLEAVKRSGPYALRELLRWYAGEEDAFFRGEGRIARGAEVMRFSMEASTDRGPALLAPARVAEIRCNIAVPIGDGGEVVALLNVDSFSSESAFGEESLRIAEAFAQHIAVIVRQAQQVRRLEVGLVTDGLTDLGNREGLERRLADELARAERYAHALSLLIVDLDNFKEVNDRHGHVVGDAALVAVADALRRELRASDLAFRWAGDEFVVLLPEVDRAEAHAAARRVEELIGGIVVSDSRLSASVGCASYPVDGRDAEELLRRADAAMYRSKQKR